MALVPGISSNPDDDDNDEQSPLSVLSVADVLLSLNPDPNIKTKNLHTYLLSSVFQPLVPLSGLTCCPLPASPHEQYV